MELQTGGPANLSENDAYPAMPDLVYGWQKLFGEQMYRAFRTSDIDIRIARFHNIFGPEGIYQGGKEKAPAALCRKVAAARDGDTIEIWGTGNQTRSFLYIDECIEGIDRIMKSNYVGPFNLGSEEKVKINKLAKMIIGISGKELEIKNVEGPEGVKARNSDNTFIRQALGWAPSAKLSEGLKNTYAWINEQVNKKSYGGYPNRGK
jgi:nucleoside-diphosphate-sugar epimerase